MAETHTRGSDSHTNQSKKRTLADISSNVKEDVTSLPSPPPSSKRSKKKGGKDKRKSGGGWTGATGGKDDNAHEWKGVRLSHKDCAPQLKLSEDRLTVTGEKGYRMVRATDGVSEGVWYYEVTILESSNPASHTRIGWATAQADIQAPVGFDKYGYSYRSLQGSAVHASLRNDNYGEVYGAGDVIGCMIYLSGKAPAQLSPLSSKGAEDALCARPASGTEDINPASEPGDQDNGATSPSEPGATSANPQSWIRFFKNGKSMGNAFTDIQPGLYFPAISLYMGAIVRVNFGPDMAFPVDLTEEALSFQMISELKEPKVDANPTESTTSDQGQSPDKQQESLKDSMRGT